MKRLSDDTRDERRGSSRGDTGSNDDSRQSEDSAINKTSSSVLVDKKLRRKLAHTISAFGGSDGVDVDNMGEGTTVNGKGRGEDELDGFARNGSGFSGALEHHSDGVDVDLYPSAQYSPKRSNGWLTLRPKSKLSSEPRLMIPWKQ